MTTRSTWQSLWPLALAVRVASAILNRTFFSPDEYWQCGEVAHKIVFGYGVFTWEWLHALRPVLPVAPLIIAYQLVAWLHLDYAWLVALVPSLIQALFASIGDVAMYHTAMRLSGPSAARWTFALHLTSHFLFYCIARPFSNSLETVLTQLAWGMWPWPGTDAKSSRAALALLLAALSVAVRPTAALTWLPLGVALLLSSPAPWALVLRFLLPIGLLVQLASAALDRVLYGRWVCVACNFVRFNAAPGLAARYGTQQWHWYWTSAWPTLLGLALPLPLVGARLAPTHLPLLTLCFVTTVLSLSPHKEFRFLLPVLPLALLLAGLALARLTRAHRHAPRLAHFTMLLSLVAGLYLATVHQRGPIALMSRLSSDERVTSVLLLMPCHSTPLYSHLHRNISVKYLDCSPPTWAQHSPDQFSYVDEADQFYAAPLEYLQDNYAPHNGSRLPSHVAFFAVLRPAIAPWLASANYTQEAELFHTQIVTDSRQSGAILLYTRTSLP